MSEPPSAAAFTLLPFDGVSHIVPDPGEPPLFTLDPTKPPLPSWRHPFFLTLIMSHLLARRCPIAKRLRWDAEQQVFVLVEEGAPPEYHPYTLLAFVWHALSLTMRCRNDSCERYCPEWGSFVFCGNDTEPSVLCFSCYTSLKQPDDAAFGRFADVARCGGQKNAHLARVPAATKVGTLRLRHDYSLRVAADEAVADVAVRHKVVDVTLNGVKKIDAPAASRKSVLALYPNAVRVSVYCPAADAVDDVWDKLCDARCHRLLWLRISGVRIDARFDAVVKQYWQRFRTLQFVDCTFDDDGIEAVAYCDDLVELTIVNAPKLTDAQVMTLVSKLREIDHLDLQGSLADDVSVATFVAMGALPRHENVDLRGKSGGGTGAARTARTAAAAQRGTKRARRLVIGD